LSRPGPDPDLQDFYPATLRAPDRLATDCLLLRPLRAADVEKDYDAVTSSAPELRCWSASDWPADGFTLAENLADLERHEREHAAREAFTYTVLDPTETRCLGCVYVQPPWTEASALCADARRAAAVGFWVRASEIPSDLDRHLLSALVEWFRRDWAFEIVLFTNAAGEERQATLLGEAGLERLPLRWPGGYMGWGFRARVEPRGRTA